MKITMHERLPGNLVMKVRQKLNYYYYFFLFFFFFFFCRAPEADAPVWTAAM
jgi:hypothetical protein